MRLVLFAHLADYPEQRLIASVAGNTAPSSIASLLEFGDPFAHELRHGSQTLEKILGLEKTVDPLDLAAFAEASKDVGLNGVHKPFWRDWKFADPCEFLAPDALHQWHKFFWVHPMKWARKLLSDQEINRRYRSLQKFVGRRHFRKGFTQLTQITGREERDLASHFLATLPNHRKITPGIMRSFRGLLDFIYLAQNRHHTTKSLSRLDKALARFHNDKAALSAAGVRNGKLTKGKFNIAKIELMWHVSRLVKLLGSAPQFSTDQTERCNMTMAKVPYRLTNHKQYPEQMCRYLDRREKIRLFALSLAWRLVSSSERRIGSQPTKVRHGNDDIASSFATFSAKFLPQTVVNLFAHQGL